MSSIYMLTQEIRFYNSIPQEGNINFLRQEANFDFPSNVLQCSLSIVNNFYNQNIPSGSSSFIYVTYVGSGIENVSCAGNQVNFTAWMQMGSADNPDISQCLNPNLSYLTIQAIAECE